MRIGSRLRLRSNLLLASTLALACATAGTSTKDLPQPARELELPTQAFMKAFDNGLTLFIVPDSYTRLIQFDVRQQVGSREDPKGKSGLAHFVEHLMFQLPSGEPGSPKLMSDIQQHALSFNAYTSSDQTHYMHTGLSDELETYMKYTAKRLAFDCDTVADESFLREREVVRNEHRWRRQGVDAFVRDEVLALVFPEGHPYRRKSMGEDPEIASITREDACGFIDTYYTASQASVVVTGDVDPDEVLALAEQYLEPLPKKPVAARAEVSPPTFTKKTAEIQAPVKKPTAMVLFSMPRRFTPDYAASQAALETMFLSIAFFTSLERSAIDQWYPAFFGGEEAPLFGVAVETKKPGQLDRAVDEVLDAITKGFGADLEGDEYKGSYDRARQRARLNVLNGIASIFGRADTFAEYLEEQPRPGFFGAELAALDDLEPMHAQQVGRRIFDRDVAMVIKVVPDGSEDKPKADRADFDYQPEEEENLAIPDDIDPEEANRPLPIREITAPEGQSLEYELENGMRVVMVQSSAIPVMDLQLIVGAGLTDSPELPQVALIAGQGYGAGSGRDAQNIMSFFNLAGGIYGSDVGPQATTFFTRGLSIYLDFIVAGLSEQVVQADYRGAIEGYKMSRKEQLEKKSALQAAERENAFYEALYGKGHPHVRPQVTDPKMLRDLSLADVEAFRAEHYRAANSALIMTGGFDLDLARQYVEAFFGKPKLKHRSSTWQDPRVSAQRPAPPEPKPTATRTITEVDKERVQTDVRIGYPLAQVYGDDHAALLVLADMLNFEVSTVRQQMGTSYGVYARVDPSRPRVEVGGSLDSARAGESLAAIRGAVQNLRDGVDFERRFAFARRNVLRGMIQAQADPQLLAGRLATAIQNGRAYDYFQQLATRVATLEPDAVKAQIQRVLDESKAVTLVQGPAEGVADVVAVNAIEGALALPEFVHDEDD